MSKNLGYTLSQKDYASVAKLVRQSRRTPPQYTRYPRKSVPFQPGTGSTVYQCVAGTRLKSGTLLYPDDTSYREPVCLCVNLGTLADDELKNLDSEQIVKLIDLSTSMGIVNADNMIDVDTLEEVANAQAVQDATDGRALVMLRCRFVSGYIGPGDIVVGNETEAWYTSGAQVLRAKLVADWVDGTDVAKAKIFFNFEAYDADETGIVTPITEYVYVQTPNDEAICMSKQDVAYVAFNHQTFLYDDKAYEDYDWHYNGEIGWVPIFTLVNPPLQQRITHVNSETQIPAYGCVVITSPGADTTGVTTVKRPFAYGAQYSHIFNGPNSILPGESGWAQTGDSRLIAAYDPADGTPAVGEMWGPYASTYKLKKNAGGFVVRGVIDSTNYLVLVDRDPMLSGIGKTDAAIAKGASGTISVYAGTLGSETDTTYNITAYNRFADVATTKWVRWAWNSGSQGYDLVSAEC